MTAFNIQIITDQVDTAFVKVDERFDVAIVRTTAGLELRIFPLTDGRDLVRPVHNVSRGRSRNHLPRKADGWRAMTGPVNTVIQGDCLSILPQLAAGSVDFVLTDPPYLVRYKDRSGGRSICNDCASGQVLDAFNDVSGAGHRLAEGTSMSAR